MNNCSGGSRRPDAGDRHDRRPWKVGAACTSLGRHGRHAAAALGKPPGAGTVQICCTRLARRPNPVLLLGFRDLPGPVTSLRSRRSRPSRSTPTGTHCVELRHGIRRASFRPRSAPTRSTPRTTGRRARDVRGRRRRGVAQQLEPGFVGKPTQNRSAVVPLAAAGGCSSAPMAAACTARRRTGNVVWSRTLRSATGAARPGRCPGAAGRAVEGFRRQQRHAVGGHERRVRLSFSPSTLRTGATLASFPDLTGNV